MNNMSERYPLFQLLKSSLIDQYYAHYRFIENPVYDILMGIIEYIAFYCPEKADEFLSVLQQSRNSMGIQFSDSNLSKIDYMFKAANLDYLDNHLRSELVHFKDNSLKGKDKSMKFQSIFNSLLHFDAKAVILNLNQSKEIFVQEIGISSLAIITILSMQDNYYILYPKIGTYGKINFKQLITEPKSKINPCLHQQNESSDRCYRCNKKNPMKHTHDYIDKQVICPREDYVVIPISGTDVNDPDLSFNYPNEKENLNGKKRNWYSRYIKIPPFLLWIRLLLSGILFQIRKGRKPLTCIFECLKLKVNSIWQSLRKICCCCLMCFCPCIPIVKVIVIKVYHFLKSKMKKPPKMD